MRQRIGDQHSTGGRARWFQQYVMRTVQLTEFGLLQSARPFDPRRQRARLQPADDGQPHLVASAAELCHGGDCEIAALPLPVRGDQEDLPGRGSGAFAPQLRRCVTSVDRRTEGDHLDPGQRNAHIAVDGLPAPFGRDGEPGSPGGDPALQDRGLGSGQPGEPLERRVLGSECGEGRIGHLDDRVGEGHRCQQRGTGKGDDRCPRGELGDEPADAQCAGHRSRCGPVRQVETTDCAGDPARRLVREGDRFSVCTDHLDLLQSRPKRRDHGRYDAGPGTPGRRIPRCDDHG